MSNAGVGGAIMGATGNEVALDRRAVVRFGELLGASPRARVDEKALWDAFGQAFPHRPSGPEERAWFVAALEALASAGSVRLPRVRSRRWDRSAMPHVPRSIDLLRTRKVVRDDDWRRQAWHPSLAWVPQLKSASAVEISFLKRVHEALVQDDLRELAPMKYRSLALTGNEKRLSALVKSRLFGEGRLSLALLNCDAELPPLAWTRVGCGSKALVFENSGPTDLAIRLLRQLLEQRGGVHPVGVVAYGGGAPFASAVARLSALTPAVTAIWYVGDVDVDGLRTAVSAATSARSVALAPLMPAPGFHEAMLREATALGHPSGWPHGSRDGESGRIRMTEELLEWLPADVRLTARKVLEQRRRIPEEVLGPSAMRRVLESVG